MIYVTQLFDFELKIENKNKNTSKSKKKIIEILFMMVDINSCFKNYKNLLVRYIVIIYQ